MPPLISIVIPVFNQPDKLRRALEAVSAQRMTDFEVIVADDGSRSPARLVVDDFKSRVPVRCLTLPHAGRPSVPRNAALNECLGTWVSFLDSDDLWDPGRLRRIMPDLRDDTDVVFHRLRVRPSQSRQFFPRFLAKTRGVGFGLRRPLDHLARVGNTIPMSSATVRLSSVLNVGGFDESLACNDDYDLWLRLALAEARFRFIPATLGTYQIGVGNISSQLAKGVLARQQFREKYKMRFPTHLWRFMDARLRYLDALAYLYSGELGRSCLVCPSLSASPAYWIRHRIHLLVKRFVAQATRLSYLTLSR